MALQLPLSVAFPAAASTEALPVLTIGDACCSSSPGLGLKYS
jgi:hypothetical protein